MTSCVIYNMTLFYDYVEFWRKIKLLIWQQNDRHPKSREHVARRPLVYAVYAKR